MRRSVVEVQGYDQPQRMKTQSMGPREVRSGQEVVVSDGRTIGMVLGIATSTFEPETMALRTINGAGAEMGVGEREHDVGVRDSWAHILDFEEVLNEIDVAIGNGPRNPELKAAFSEFTANRNEGALNLVDVEILEDNPGWRNKDQDRKGGIVELNTDTMMSEAGFSLG